MNSAVISHFLWLSVVFLRSDFLNPGLGFNGLISHDPPLSLVFVSTSFILALLGPNSSAVIICLISNVYFASILFKLPEKFSTSALNSLLTTRRPVFSVFLARSASPKVSYQLAVCIT